jgi:hypothetical protein
MEQTRKRIELVAALLGVIGGLLVLAGIASPFVAELGELGWGAGGALVVFGLSAIASSAGLKKLAPGGRVAAIVVCAIALLIFPLGTALGAYGLWVLLSEEAETIFRTQTYEPKPLYRDPIAPSPLERRRKIQGIVMRFLFAVIALAGAVLFLSISPLGKGVLPEDLRASVAGATRELAALGSKATKAQRRGPPAFYKFTDDEGVVHVVDDLRKVPEKYRKRAEKTY